jgi:hypothetical protein
MNHIAHNIQYPVTCPACSANTAHALSKLLTQETVTCRHCKNEFSLEKRLRSSIERTLNELECCTSNKSSSGHDTSLEFNPQDDQNSTIVEKS